ncbi:MAG TPA: hypothetical protein VET23_14505 [Chitinophagaceae bacterium]|nr:hypothetical protein [Chitinophagaceae bacterium]
MKTVLLIFVLATIGSVKAQTLKDALYSGKLKTDTGTVIKKGDSLQLRKDLPQKPKSDSLKKGTTSVNSLKINSSDTSLNVTSANAPLDNNKIWKQFIDEYSGVIKSEVLPSKKIKKGTYSVYIDYAIETDGSVSTVNIICVPENSYLVEQVKTRMMANTPQLNPVLMSNGKPRKALKKQLLTFSKEKD